MTKREKVLKSWVELKGLWAEKELMSYEAFGERIGNTHCRQVGRIIGVIQEAIEVYNLQYDAQVPHINALVVNKRRRKPGVGCLTDKPHLIQAFDYTPMFDRIENILKFISEEKFESYFRTLAWEELAPTFLSLLPKD